MKEGGFVKFVLEMLIRPKKREDKVEDEARDVARVINITYMNVCAPNEI